MTHHVTIELDERRYALAVRAAAFRGLPLEQHLAEAVTTRTSQLWGMIGGLRARLAATR